MSRRMNPVDASWLFVDSKRTPMHIGLMAVFSLPPQAPPSFLKSLFEHLRQPAGFAPPFNLRLRGPRPSHPLPHWVEEDRIDLDYHLRHSALPQPGGERELGMLVSRLHSHPLDLARPLWECHIIEGLYGEDGSERFALYMKVHHSLVDGVGGMRMLGRLLSVDPQAVDLPPPWAVGSGEKRSLRRGPGPSWDELVKQARQRFGYVPIVGRALVDTWRDALHGSPDEAGLPFRAPRSILNGQVSGQRRFATQHYDLIRLRRIAKATKVTANDVFLAICAGALRRYLEELDVLPEEPLTAGLPVSVRPRHDDASGNAISFIIANLHTHLADPLERLAAIRRSTVIAKSRFAQLPRGAISGYTVLFMAPFMLQLMTGLGGVFRPMFNVTISNVPGPEATLYFNGARMEQIYPLSLLSHGQALNITVVSYAGQFNIGYTGCRDALPHMQRLAVYTGEALEELERRLGL